jgi:protein phosphatase
MIKKQPCKKLPSLKWSGWTDRGNIRPNNEDSFLGLQFDAREAFRLGKFGEASLDKMDFTFAVSDGMGGALAGEFASRIAVQKITTLLPRAFQHSAPGLQPGFSDVLAELFTQIHCSLAFVGGSYEETEGMQTTLSLCWFAPGWMYFGHVGDSRIYHLPKRKKTIKQLTHDDTYVGWLFRNGKINEYEARTHPRRNVLQKALGGSNQFVDPQVGALACERGDIFLICTDGLVEGLLDNQLVEILREPQSSRQIFNPAQLLVETSVKNSGRDNTTALVIQVV